MSESLRELVRYELPGYICIIWALFLLFPFLNLNEVQKHVDFLRLLALSLAGLISGIPLGWLLYQIYASFLHIWFGRKYAWRKPLRILKGWDEKLRTCPQFRNHLMDYALQKNGFSQKASVCWAHTSSRIVVSGLVPFASIALSLVIYVLIRSTPYSNVFSTDSGLTELVTAGVMWVFISVIFFVFVLLGTFRILDEIQQYILYSLIDQEEKIKGLINHELADKAF